MTIGEEQVIERLGRLADLAPVELRAETPLPDGDVPRRRHRRLVVVGLAAAVVIAALVGALVWQATDETRVVTSVPPNPPTTVRPPDTTDLPQVTVPNSATPSVTDQVLPGGGTAPVPPAPINGRILPAAVWTGTEMLVWGGDDYTALLADGAAFDPAAGTWRMLPPAPLAPRSSPAAVWTGSEMIVWGGQDVSMAEQNADHTSGTSPRSTPGFTDGAAYDPATDEWRVLADGGPAWGSGALAVWTETEVIVLSGDAAAAYDPERDEWRDLAPTNRERRPRVHDGGVDRWRAYVATLAHQERSPYAEPSLERYEPATDAWTTIDVPVSNQVSAVWTGEELLLLAPDPNASSVAYDPANRRWRALSPPPLGWSAASTRRPMWTGHDVVFTPVVPTSYVYRPDLDRWGIVGTPQPPGRDWGASTVQADGLVISWGGVSTTSQTTAAIVPHDPQISAGTMLRAPDQLPATPRPPERGDHPEVTDLLTWHGTDRITVPELGWTVTFWKDDDTGELCRGDECAADVTGPGGAFLGTIGADSSGTGSTYLGSVNQPSGHSDPSLSTLAIISTAPDIAVLPQPGDPAWITVTPAATVTLGGDIVYAYLVEAWPTTLGTRTAAIPL